MLSFGLPIVWASDIILSVPQVLTDETEPIGRGTKIILHLRDDAEEYLTGDTLVDSPFVRGFEVLADLNNNTREIRDYFRTSPFGQVEIKCRHMSIDADAIRRKLPLPGNEPGVLLFVRVAGKARAIVAKRCQ